MKPIVMPAGTVVDPPGGRPILLPASTAADPKKKTPPDVWTRFFKKKTRQPPHLASLAPRQLGFDRGTTFGHRPVVHHLACSVHRTGRPAFGHAVAVFCPARVHSECSFPAKGPRFKMGFKNPGSGSISSLQHRPTPPPAWTPESAMTGTRSRPCSSCAGTALMARWRGASFTASRGRTRQW
jgi:hypothetical protein